MGIKKYFVTIHSDNVGMDDVRRRGLEKYIGRRNPFWFVCNNSELKLAIYLIRSNMAYFREVNSFTYPI